ncbi:MAG: hypothetical protein WD773_08970 [Gemmatimonadales bacterium]
MTDSRYRLVEEWCREHLFKEQGLEAGLEVLAEWGEGLSAEDRAQVRLLAIPSVLRALPPDAPAASAERLVGDALGVGAPEEALALAMV